MRKRILWIAAALAAAVMAASTVWAYAATAAHRFSAADAGVPEHPVAIVLGAGVRDGMPTRLLANRLDLARDLYEAGKVQVILVTGDNSTETYNETDVMRDYLLASGVEEDRVVADHAGLRTWDSCVRAREVFGVESATVITQHFHLPRAVALCRAAGIDADGVGDASLQSRGPATVYGYAREVPASVLAWADAKRQPDPAFLGPREDGVEAALELAEDAGG